MRNSLIIVLSFYLSQVGWSQNVNIPDANFKKALVENTAINTNGDTEIQVSEAIAVSLWVDVSNKEIKDLTGIEAFVNFRRLRCQGNQLTSLDLSNNVNLTHLECSLNKLTSLDLSNNINLTRLSGNSNKLTSLDVSANTALTSLDCSASQLTSLDISNNTALTHLGCYGNQLISLDLSNNTALQSLSCYSNKLTNLDINNNINLQTLYCNSNQLTSLDISKNTKLSLLSCGVNQLSRLDVSIHTGLVYLYCESNQLTSLDVTKNIILQQIDCNSNQLTSLDFSNNTVLTSIVCNNNHISFLGMESTISSPATTKTRTPQDTIFRKQSIFLGDTINYSPEASVNNKNVTFNWFKIGETSARETNTTGVFIPSEAGEYYTQMTHPDFTDITYLQSYRTTVTAGDSIVYIPDTNFKKALIENTAINTNGDTSIKYSEAIAFGGEINVGGKGIKDLIGIEAFVNLTTLKCSGNPLGNLDISKNTLLQILHCGGNQLTTLDVSSNVKLTELWCISNQLKSIDVSALLLLQKLYVDDNSLSTLNVTKNTALSILWCKNTDLSSLDISNNTKLTFLKSSDNSLTTLDVSQHILLKTLNCTSNQIEVLSVDKNTALEELYCSHNQLKTIDVNQNPSLKRIDCNDNEITSLSFANNLLLESINCNNNELISLDISKNTALKYVWCWANRLTRFDVSNNVGLEKFECRDNVISFLGMESTISSPATTKTRTPQDTIFRKQSIFLGDTINYSPEASVNNKNVTFNWFKIGETSARETNTTGVFIPSEAGEYYTQMTHPDFTDITYLESHRTTVISGDSVVYIPDSVFKAILIANPFINTNRDTSIQYSEARAYNRGIRVSNKEIEDLTGIEAFVNITELQCHQNKLTELDVSKNTELIDLRCMINNIKSLDLSNNTKLTLVSCYGNDLTALDVSNCGELDRIDCYQNDLTHLEFNDNTKLTFLNCSQNDLVSLDISMNVLLSSLNCGFNELANLDLSTNLALVSFQCNNNNLTSLDVTQCVVLKSLGCQWNEFTSLDVSKNIALTALSCNSNRLSELDVSKNTALLTLHCFGADLEILDLSSNLLLTDLWCYDNALTSVDVSKNIALTRLWCENNQLVSLDLSNNTLLTSLRCSKNALSALDITSNTALTSLTCNDNELSFKGMESTIASIATTKIRNPQDEVFAKTTITKGDTINYSSEASVNNKNVTFNWYKVGETSARETNTTGIYIPSEVGQFYTRMTHPDFTDITYLESHRTTVMKEVVVNEYDAFNVVTNASEDEANVELSISNLTNLPETLIQYVFVDDVLIDSFPIKNRLELSTDFNTHTIKFCTSINDCLESIVTINQEESVATERPDKWEVKVYNVLTPNGDGVHDYLEIVIIENEEEFNSSPEYPMVVKIYTKWGDLLYSSQNYQASVEEVWKGNDINGKQLINGTYYYVVEFVYENDEAKKRYKNQGGFVLLKR